MFAYPHPGVIPYPGHPGYRPPPGYHSDDSGRMSSTSSSNSSAGISPKRSRSGRLSEEVGSWDSGLEEAPGNALGGSRSPSASVPAVTWERLDQCSVDYSVRLRSLVAHADFFRRLASREGSACDDLLEEMRRKLKPRLLALDEDVMEVCHEIKIDIDRCRITDQRLTMLLAYNEILQGVHSQLEKMLTKVLDQLEHHLNVLDRGAFDIPNRHVAIARAMRDIAKVSIDLEKKARDEGIRHRQHSPGSTRTASSGSSARTSP